ncbi:putative kinase [Entophlyctis sp. JEL0112]|nr:putative kinase [Entophlyctis sp. JEL0112]
MENPAEAHRRRGAPFTFDAEALVSLVTQLKAPSEEQNILAPSFDHSMGDPVPGAISIPYSTQFIILEGLYLHLSVLPWMRMEFDERWFLGCDEQVALQRLVDRHIATGVSSSHIDALKRINESDLLNGKYVLENRLPSDLEVQSIPSFENQ